MLRHRLEEVVVFRRKLGRRLLEVECGHWSTQHGKVDGDRHRSTPLTFVSCVWSVRMKVGVDTELVLLEHANVRLWLGKMDRGLGRRSHDAHGW